MSTDGERRQADWLLQEIPALQWCSVSMCAWWDWGGGCPLLSPLDSSWVILPGSSHHCVLPQFALVLISGQSISNGMNMEQIIQNVRKSEKRTVYMKLSC